MTRRDQFPPRAGAKLLRQTTGRTLMPESKRPNPQMLPERTTLSHEHHTADGACAHSTSTNSRSPRRLLPKRNGTKILKNP